MKNFILIGSILCLLFSSCETTEEMDPEEYLGTWSMTSFVNTGCRSEADNGEDERWESRSWTFNSDGTGELVSLEYGAPEAYKYEFTYRIVGGELYTTEVDDTNEYSEGTIEVEDDQLITVYDNIITGCTETITYIKQ
ncbi:hypothetical protein [Flammeovirga sp. SJP92]|uniref:hypothetical protein n=1 Tax=Flammeovirga sp. SJP92 TaxID=1775430 RepID=UPI0007893F7A|nr:hypothetical protein [Flammeovirga sp. SJP92]KXX66779.1 hypothetical protein AVL50_30060 [Flammeovirga sp. SJP92]